MTNQTVKRMRKSATQPLILLSAASEADALSIQA